MYPQYYCTSCTHANSEQGTRAFTNHRSFHLSLYALIPSFPPAINPPSQVTHWMSCLNGINCSVYGVSPTHRPGTPPTTVTEKDKYKDDEIIQARHSAMQLTTEKE